MWGSCQASLTSVLHVKEQSLVSRKQLKTLESRSGKYTMHMGAERTGLDSAHTWPEWQQEGARTEALSVLWRLKKTFDSKRLILPH